MAHDRWLICASWAFDPGTSPRTANPGGEDVRHRTVTLALTVGCAGFMLVGAQTVAARSDATSPAAAFDKHFVMEAAQGNMFEIGAGRLAAQYGVSAVCS